MGVTPWGSCPHQSKILCVRLFSNDWFTALYRFFLTTLSQEMTGLDVTKGIPPYSIEKKILRMAFKERKYTPNSSTASYSTTAKNSDDRQRHKRLICTLQLQTSATRGVIIEHIYLYGQNI